jgi:ABC-type glycerol-3-phosphate transport system substrate-binding protein
VADAQLPAGTDKPLTVDEWIEILDGIKEKGGGTNLVVFKTAGAMYPNATYCIVPNPPYAYEKDKRIQLFPGRRLGS